MTGGVQTAGTVDTQTAPKAKLTEDAIRYAMAERKISQETLERLGAVSATVFFPRLDPARKSDAIVFPFYVDGQRVNWKASAYPEKSYTSETGGKLAFFNLDRILGSETVYITEGEWDAAALIEAGVSIEQVTSVPNGARDRKEDDPDAELTGYDYVTEGLAAGLSRVKRFVFCGDNDPAGHTLRHDLARIIGPARFWFVDWPEGCKDANDYLRSDGPDAVRDLVLNGALPWPVAGLYRLSELPEPPPLVTWEPGFPEWESKVRMAPRTLSVVTGHPGHGKTHLWVQIWQQIILRYGLVAAVASFETRAKPHQRRILRTLISGQLEMNMTDEARRKADRWIDERYLWLEHPNQKPTLQWLLDTAEVAVVRHGARIVQIDPWNRLESMRPGGESETDYIGRCLTELYVFAQDMNCHVQVIAHPAKMDPKRRAAPPDLEDIAGSKHWDNRVDQGFVVHRPIMFKDGKRQTEAFLWHKKSRFDELGYICRLGLELDLKAGRYVSTDYRQSWEGST